MRKVPIWALKPGMEIARPVYDSHNHLLLNVGIKLEIEYIQSLKRLDIPAIYVVNPLIPDVKIEDVIFTDTRHKAMQLARKLLVSDVNTSKKSRFPFAGLFTLKRELNELVDEMIAQLLNCRELVINLCDIQTVDNHTFAHSANVAVLSLVLATAMGLSRHELRTVGLGSFLHDLGKSLIHPSVLNKAEELLPEEWTEIKQHPAYGYDLINKQSFGDSAVGKIVYQHHERVNGKGYPKGLSGEEIHTYSKICAIADVYDALISERPYRPAYPPYRALKLFQSEMEGYDPEIFQVFSRHIPAYPVGTLVALSNETIGIVVKNCVGYPTRPSVRILCEVEGYVRLPAYELDLSEKQNSELVIDVVYEDQNFISDLERKLTQ